MQNKNTTYSPSKDAFLTNELPVPEEITLQCGVWNQLPFVHDIFSDDRLPQGYAFAGWSSVVSGTADYIDGEYVKDLVGPGENTALYGAWVRRYYYINYNANGGTIFAPSGEEEIDYRNTQLVSSTEMVLMPSGDVVKREGGWELDGWSRVPYGLAGYQPGSRYSEIFADYTTGTLYAIWRPLKYKVIFHSNWPKEIAGKSEETHEQELEYNIIQALDTNPFEFVHWEFVGWSTTTDGPVVYLDEQRVTNISEDKEIDLYARWKQVEFVMTFHKNAPDNSTDESNDEYARVTDDDIAGTMQDQIFRLNVVQAISANEFVYPEEVSGVPTLDRGFNGWLTASGGYTEADDGRNRIKWLNCEEITLDQDIDVYAFWDDCIYLEYDATNFRRLRRDFEQNYRSIAESIGDESKYRLTDRIHPGTRYLVRNNFENTLYGCNLVAWGSRDGTSFQPGDDIMADLFDAGEHFELVPLYERRIENYNAENKVASFLFGLDSTKVSNEDYIKGQWQYRRIDILPRGDYIEEYLDVNITATIRYRETGGRMTLYWKPESDPDCEWQQLYSTQSGAAGSTHKQELVISVPGWFDETIYRYVYHLVIVACPYNCPPPTDIPWGDPNSVLVRGWKKKWKKWKHKITNALGYVALTIPTGILSSAVFKNQRKRLKKAVNKTAREIARFKIAGHHPGKAVISAIASKEFKIITSAVAVIAGIVTCGLGGVTVSAVSSILAGACSIAAASTNDKTAKAYLDAASITFSVVSIGAGLNFTGGGDEVYSHARAIENNAVDSAVDRMRNSYEIFNTQLEGPAPSEIVQQAYNRYLGHVDDVRSALIHRGSIVLKEDLIKLTGELSETTRAISTSLGLVSTIGAYTGLFDAISLRNGLPRDLNAKIENIYIRNSDGHIFVESGGGIVFEAVTPGVDFKPICMLATVSVDSIIYPSNDQGIQYNNG